ncbi:MAG: class I SAM-dependent methyltransferase [Patescibacteria group bacterium]
MTESRKDITIYESEQEHYEKLTSSRKDYARAIEYAATSAFEFFPDGDVSKAIVCDFCCGPGVATKWVNKYFGEIGVAVLIDIDKKFIDLAVKANIAANQVLYVHSDILKVDFEQLGLESKADIVFGTYSYHHIPDELKSEYVEQAYRVLKPGGVVILNEIYLKQEWQIPYYETLTDDSIENVPEEFRHKFRRMNNEVARSSNFEFKVEMEYARADWKRKFKELRAIKVWPFTSTHDFLLSPTVGSIVHIFQKQ